jgi:subtilase family serine protease
MNRLKSLTRGAVACGAGWLLSFNLVHAALPDLAPLSIQMTSPVVGPPNPTATLICAVTNEGAADATGYWYDRLFVSTQPVYDNSAIYVTDNIEFSLPSGAAHWTTNNVQLPVTESGQYYILLVPDVFNYVVESDESNNLLAFPFTFQSMPADLTPIAFQAPTTVTAPPYPNVTVVRGVANQGAGIPLGNYYWADQLVLSPTTDPSLGTSVLWQYETGPLAPGGSYWRTNSVQLPVTQSGSYYLIFQTDPANTLYESNTNNNMVAVPITLTITPSDLVPYVPQAPSVVNGPPYPAVTLAWGSTNQGIGAALGYWYDAAYLSTNNVLDYSASYLGYASPGGLLAPGAAYAQTNQVRLPIVQSGNYFLLFQSDYNGNVFESDESNNLLVLPLTFNSQPPDLAPIALQAAPTVTAPPNPTITVTWGVTNQGTGEARGNSYWYDQLFLSTNANPNAGVAVAYGSETGPVAPGGSYWRTNFVTLPVTQSGTYYLIFQTDLGNYLSETSTNNNTLVVPVQITITFADLVPLAFQAPSVVNGPPFPAVRLVWGATNQGVGAALGYWDDVAYFSSTTNFDYSSSIANANIAGPLAPGGTYRYTNTVRLPVTQSGVYYYGFRADQYNDVVESNESNNLVVLPVTFNSMPPDLAPVALLAPATVTAPPNPTVSIAWGVTNRGTGEARGYDSWPDQLFLSSSNSPDGGTPVLSTFETGPTPPAGSYWRTNTVRLPVLQSGTYYLVFKTDTDGSLYESNTNNNSIVVPITFNITPSDLVPAVVQAPSILNGPAYALVRLVWGSTNQGTGAALDNWQDTVYLSTNTVVDATASPVTWNYISGPLLPGNSYRQTNDVRLPLTHSGNYYFLFQSDSQDNVYESNETNNLLARPLTFTLQPPDLAPISLQAPANVTAPPNPAVAVVWGVTNQGTGEARAYPYSWTDHFFLANSNSPDATPLFSYYSYEAGPVGPGGTYWRTNSIHLSVLQSGTYYLIFKTDEDNNVLESNTGNNTIIVPITFNITPPDLAPIAFIVPSTITAPPNPVMSFTYGVTNQGIGPALADQSWRDNLFISTNSVLDASATSFYYNFGHGPLPPGGSYWTTDQVTVPVTRSGIYYLFFNTDDDAGLVESNPSNNVAVASVTFTITPADLAPVRFSVPASVTGPPDPKFLVSWAVTNLGPGAALGYWPDRLYLSTNTVLDWTATLLLQDSGVGTLPVGGSYSRSHAVAAPVTQSGNYYLIFQADPENLLYEANTNNNTAVAPVTFHINPPDLAPILLQVPSVVNGPLNPRVTLSYGITNQGTGQALAAQLNGYPYGWYDQLFISTNSVRDGTETLIENYYGWAETGPVDPGQAYWRTRTVQIPVTTSGLYYLILEANYGSYLFESNPTNNDLAVPVTFNVQPPDLAPVALIAPNILAAPAYPRITVAWGVTNRGSAPAVGFPYWSDQLYLSTDTNLDWPGVQVVATSEYGPILPGGSYWRTNSFQLPVNQSGSYYLVFTANAYQALAESDENNNTLVAPLTFQLSLPDLAPLTMQSPHSITGPARTSFDVVVGVTNQGPGQAVNSWYSGWQDELFLSTNPVVDASATFLAWQYETGPVAPGETYWSTNRVALPAVPSGNYFLILSVNSSQDLPETNFTNNTIAVPLVVQMTPPDLAPIAFLAPAVVNGPPEPSVTLVWAVTNRGPGQANISPGFDYWQDSVYLSSDLSGLYQIASRPETNALPPGGIYWRTNTARVPVYTNGSYYLVFETDSYNGLGETNFNNNTVSIPITFHIGLADLAPLALQAPATVSGPPNSIFTVTWGVTNRGAATATSHWERYDQLYISSHPVLDDSAIFIPVPPETNDVPVGGNFWRTNSIRLPAIQSGPYYLLFNVNRNFAVQESDYANNLIVTPITFDVRPPDLATFAWQVPATVTSTPWPTVTLVAGVTNQGVGAALGGWDDGVYLATTPFLDDYAFPIATSHRTNPLPSGGVYWVTNTITLHVADSATWYLFFKADAYNSVGDANPQNNLAVGQVVFNLSPPGDLVALELDAPSVVTGPPQPAVSVAWRVSNQGLGTLAGHWTDNLYLSDTPTVNWWALPFLTVPITNSLQPGAAYWQSNSFTLPLAQSASFYLVVQANSSNSVFETDFGDNVIATPVRFDLNTNSILHIGDVRFLPNGSFQVAAYGVVGAQYALQASSNLVNWVVVSNFTMASLPTYVVDTQARQFQRRFYRLAAVAAPPPPPALAIRRSGNSVVLAWPSPSTGWVLQQNSSGLGTPDWNTVGSGIQDDGTNKTLTISPPTGTRFFRLFNP